MSRRTAVTVLAAALAAGTVAAALLRARQPGETALDEEDELDY